MKSQSNTNLVIRSSLALALALAIWSPVQALSAGPGDGKMMEGNMMNQTDGWMGGWVGGGMWLWTVVGILVIVLLVVVISRLINK
ncbi:MAG: hypothetical protein ACYDHG_07125 [Desulfomonilaceae bacterium]